MSHGRVWVEGTGSEQQLRRKGRGHGLTKLGIFAVKVGRKSQPTGTMLRIEADKRESAKDNDSKREKSKGNAEI